MQHASHWAWETAECFPLVHFFYYLLRCLKHNRWQHATFKDIHYEHGSDDHSRMLFEMQYYIKIINLLADLLSTCCGWIDGTIKTLYWVLLHKWLTDFRYRCCLFISELLNWVKHLQSVCNACYRHVSQISCL